MKKIWFVIVFIVSCTHPGDTKTAVDVTLCAIQCLDALIEQAKKDGKDDLVRELQSLKKPAP